jgi:hypothetical protein
VYHYTSMQAMMSIVQNASIWATSIRYLNDYTEGEHFTRVVKQRAPAFCRSRSIDPKIFEEMARNQSDFIWRPFVASFSREPDSLTQWRSYCPSGNGISLGFRVDCLKRASVLQDHSTMTETFNGTFVTFDQVQYVDDLDEESLDVEIALVTERAQRLLQSWVGFPGSEPPTLADFVRIIVANKACRRKHGSFRSESEYRLVIDGLNGYEHLLEFRPTRSTLIPFVRASIPRKMSGFEFEKLDEGRPAGGSLANLNRLLTMTESHDFISEVWIGPTPNTQLSFEAVSAFFKKMQMSVTVHKSEVPYRDW